MSVLEWYPPAQISSPHVVTRDWVWSDFQHVALPSSAKDGPRRTDHGLASGFSQTPEGAVLAAMNVAERANALSGPAVFRPTIRHQVINPDDLLSEQQYTYDHVVADRGLTRGQPLPREAIRYIAFAWKGYTATAAALDLLAYVPDSTGCHYIARRIQLEWDDGDWKLHAPEYGDWTLAETIWCSTRGFQPFAGRQVER